MKQRKSRLSTSLLLRYLVTPPLIGFLITLFSYPSGLRSAETMLYVLIYSYSIGLPSIALVMYAGKRIDRYYSWLEKPLRKLLLSIVIEVVLVLLVVVLVKLVFIFAYWQDFSDLFRQLSDGFIWAVSITVFGIAIGNGFLFFRNWRQSTLNEEILKREKLALEYEALRNQVNPHFLFNSLTALTTLVHQDADKAEAFVRRFSDVYRYVLENHTQEIVSLDREVELIQNMAYLYHYRHGENLRIELELEVTEEKYILPMALQMLLENALKHNVISEEKPLKVRIYESDNYIVVWNKLQLRSHVSESNRVGLGNIRLRYSYLSERPVQIEHSKDFFQVKIPILSQS
jgi:two-component system, LytTR family, sensor kinase